MASRIILYLYSMLVSWSGILVIDCDRRDDWLCDRLRSSTALVYRQPLLQCNEYTHCFFLTADISAACVWLMRFRSASNSSWHCLSACWHASSTLWILVATAWATARCLSSSDSFRICHRRTTQMTHFTAHAWWPHHKHYLPTLRLCSHWHEYEFRVRVSVYVSYKLHLYK